MTAPDEAVQIFGGYGYMRDYPVEMLMRDVAGTEIYEGMSEIIPAADQGCHRRAQSDHNRS